MPREKENIKSKVKKGLFGKSLSKRSNPGTLQKLVKKNLSKA